MANKEDTSESTRESREEENSGEERENDLESGDNPEERERTSGVVRR
jgi:hypothetical protein